MTEPYRIRSAETWAQAREDYLAGMDAEAVCRRYDLGLSAFRRRARREGWRRMDQGDPPIDTDLSIYDDIDPTEQADLARLRFLQALNHGKAVEAARWRRLWLEMRDANAALDADLFPGMSPAQVSALLAADYAAVDANADRLALLAPGRSPALASPEKVHDVHANFSGGDCIPRPGPQPATARTLRNRTLAAP